MNQEQVHEYVLAAVGAAEIAQRLLSKKLMALNLTGDLDPLAPPYITKDDYWRWEDLQDEENDSAPRARAISTKKAVAALDAQEDALVAAAIPGPSRLAARVLTSTLKNISQLDQAKGLAEKIRDGVLTAAAKLEDVKLFTMILLDLLAEAHTRQAMKAAEEVYFETFMAFEFYPFAQSDLPRTRRKVQSRMPKGGH